MTGRYFKLFAAVMGVGMLHVAVSPPAQSFLFPPMCVIEAPPNMWRGQHRTTKSVLINAVDDMAAAWATENKNTADALIAAIKVSTKQEALSGQHVAVAGHKVTEMAAEALNANMARIEAVKAVETYGEMGQPPDPCEVTMAMAELTQTGRGQKEFAKVAAASAAIDIRAGAAPDMSEVVKRRLQNASEETVNVAKSLLDVNAKTDVVNAFINNVTGFPKEKPDRSSGNFQLRDIYTIIEANRLEALRSPALHSLTTIRAAYVDISSAGGGGSTAGKSLQESMEWLLDRYGGGDKYDEWSAKMATKSEVGIVKEIAKLRAMQMMFKKWNRESDERIAVIFATLIAVGEKR